MPILDVAMSKEEFNKIDSSVLNLIHWAETDATHSSLKTTLFHIA